jgi:mobilization protein NikA
MLVPFREIFIVLPRLEFAGRFARNFLKVCQHLSRYARDMEAAAYNPEIPSSFAGALAAFAAEAPGAGDKSAASNGDGLADDVATLSYENALRARSRFKAADSSAAESGSSDATEHGAVVPDREHKSASITIRLSHAECVQLKKRAAAANLTVSAYMRSCILEAETLRAQVKEALAELRAATPDETRIIQHSNRQAPRSWWRVVAPTRAWR